MSTLKRKAETQAGSEAKKAKASSNILNFFGPKSTSTSASSPTSAPAEPEIKFDKQKWLGGLTDEQKQLLSLEIETLHHSWLAHLKDDITSKDFLELKRFLNREAAAGKKVFPPPEDVYSWYVMPAAQRACTSNLSQQGPGTPPSTTSRSSSSARTRTTTSTRRTGSPFLFGRQRRRRRRCATSSCASRTTTPRSWSRRPGAAC